MSTLNNSRHISARRARFALLTGAASLVLVAAWGRASAQTVAGDRQEADQSAGTTSQPSSTVADVVVTGSHIKGAVSTGPVQEITHDDIINGGFSTVAQALSSLPANFGGGVNLESTGSIPGEATGGRDYSGVNNASASTANLRGLGSTSTLVLLDGARLPPKADGVGVDLSMIPLSAVERIEVLADGASAVYGSDAVAGVVNIITRHDYDGFQTRVRYDDVANGTPNYQISQTLGINWSTGNLLLNFEHQDDGDIDARYRAATADLAMPNYLYAPQHENSIYLSLSQAVAASWTTYAEGYYSSRNLNVDANTSLPGEVAVVNDQITQDDGGALIFGLKNGDSGRVHIDAFATIGRMSTDYRLNPNADAVADGVDPERTLQTYNTASGELRLSGDVLTLSSGTVKAAGGASYRSESAKQEVFPGMQQFDRSVYAIYGELYVPLVGGAATLPYLERASLTFAGRYDHYSDFGGTFNPRVGLSINPTNDIAIKASYSTSFRAPSAYEAATAGGVNLVNLATDPLSSTGKTLILFRDGQNPDLKPETARSITGGLDFHPRAVAGLHVSADYYNIDFHNRIEVVDASNGALRNLADPLAQGIINRSPTSAQIADALAGSTPLENLTFNPSFTSVNPASIQAIVDNRFQNAAEVRTSGFDVVASQAIQSSFGHWDATANATYILNYDQRLAQGEPFVSLLNTTYEPVGFKARMGLSWMLQDWSAAVFVNYVNRYTDNTVPSAPAKIGAWTTADIHFAYQFNDGYGWHALRNTTLSVNVRNVTDAEPPLLAASAYGFRYDPANSSAIGRVISFELVKAW